MNIFRPNFTKIYILIPAICLSFIILISTGCGEIGGLIDQLSSPDSNEQSKAVDRLVEIGGPAVAPLIKAAASGNQDTSKNAIEALTKIGDPAVEPLIASLSSNDHQEQMVAIIALGNIGDPRAIEPLIKTLNESSVDDTSVFHSLSQMGPDAATALVEVLKNEKAYLRRDAAIYIGKIGAKSSVVPLIQTLKSDNDSLVRGEAATALGLIGDPRSFDSLVSALDDQGTTVAGKAAEALGDLNDSRASEILLEKFKSKPSEELAYALGKLKVRPAVDPLLAFIYGVDGSGQRYVHKSAIAALGAIGDPKAISPLLAILNSNVSIDVDSWDSVTAALAKIGEPAVDPLIAILLDSSRQSYDRELVAKALGQIKDPRAINPLQKVISSSQDRYSTQLRSAASAALNEIQGPGTNPG